MRIEKLIERYAEKVLFGMDASPEEKKIAKECFVETVLKNTKDDYERVLRDEIIKNYKKDQIKNVLIQSVIIAFLIGLSVNQMTDIATKLKGSLSGMCYYIVTLAVAGAFMVTVFAILLRFYKISIKTLFSKYRITRRVSK